MMYLRTAAPVIRQQLKDEANEPIPFVPVSADVLVDPAAKPVKPDVPAAGEEFPLTLVPAQTVLVLLGAGILIIGLTPPLSTSVAPSGIAFPPTADPGFASGDAIPLDAVVGGVEVQKLEMIAVPGGKLPTAAPVNPPPSKPELAPLVVDPGICDELVPVGEPIIPTQLAPVPGMGLSPPGSISVAPSGMPVAGDPVEPPGTPRGEVVGMVVMVVFVVAWAAAMPQPSEVASRTNSRRLIEIS